MVSLVPITAANWRAALSVSVQPERQQWVSSVSPVALMILAKSYIRPDGQVWHPFTIVDDDALVGVVAVGVDDPAAGVVQTAWLHHFLIDQHRQGIGHGRSAMREIARWLQRTRPTVTLVGLCVLPENTTAFALYGSLGFEKIGVTTDDQHILVATLTDLLDDSRYAD